MNFNNYIGIPYKELNCWQLICKVYKEQLDISLPSFSNEYTSGKDKDGIKKIFEREFKNWLKRTSDPILYDIVSMRVYGQPWHTGMIIHKPYLMLHVMPNYHSIIERIDSPIWKGRILGFYRYKGKHGSR